jgi:hypothetical protein
VKTTGRWTCNLKYVRSGEKINLTGKCNGKSVDEDHDDTAQKEHQVPQLNTPKQD